MVSLRRKNIEFGRQTAERSPAMTRKFLCAALALLMVLSGVSYAHAASHTNHPACGASCSHEEAHSSLSASSWTSSYTLSGDRYLASNQTISRSITVSSNARLCLNGYTITFAAGYGLKIKEGVSLEICDCRGTGGIVRAPSTTGGDSSLIVNHGTLVIYGGSCRTEGMAINLQNSSTGTLNVYGGTFGIGLSNYGTAVIHNASFDLPKTNSSPYPEALYNGETGTLTVHDGTFRAYGNALDNLGTATVHGGTFQCLRDDNIGCDGISNSGKLTVHGGHISAVRGDGIYNAYDSSSSKGLLYVHGGTVTANADNCAAVYNRDCLYVYGGTLSGYMGIYNGTGLSGTDKDGGTCKVTGGTVTGTLCGIRNSGGTSTSYNNGVATQKSSRGILTVEEAPSISSILLEYPKALTFHYTGTDPVPIQVDTDYLKVGDVIAVTSSSYLRKMTAATEGYVLQRGTYPNSTSDVVLATDACGADGDNLRWKLSQDGVLTIYGAGDMQDFSSSSYLPWNYDKTGIHVTQIVLDPDMTSIGSAAFSYLDKVTELTVPEGVTRLNNWCLEGMTSMAALHLPSTLTDIGNVFASHNLPANLQTITYPGCIHQWGRITFGRYATKFTPTDLLENANEDDGSCLTELRCSVCGGVDKAARESHTGGTATCTALAQCEVCGTPYGDYGHDYRHVWEENALVYHCTLCGDGRTVYLTLTPGEDGTFTVTGALPDGMTVYAAAYEDSGRMLALETVTPGQELSLPAVEDVRLFVFDGNYVPLTTGN